MNFLANCPGEKLLTSPQDLPLKERVFLTLLLNSGVYIFWRNNYYAIPLVAFYLFVGLAICYSVQKIKAFLQLDSISIGAENQIGKSCLQFFTDPEKMALAIKGSYVHGYAKINTFIGLFRKTIMFQDSIFSFKVILSLYMVMKLAIILGDFGSAFLFVNWFCWQEKFSAVVNGFYQLISGKIQFVQGIIPKYKEEEQQQQQQ